MPQVAKRSAQERDRILACLRSMTPGCASRASRSDVLDEVLPAYGDLDVDVICGLAAEYAREHAEELQGLLRRQRDDHRRPWLLSDPALLLVLERLEHDRYTLRRTWAATHNPRDLRRIADLWGVRSGL